MSRFVHNFFVLVFAFAVVVAPLPVSFAKTTHDDIINNDDEEKPDEKDVMIQKLQSEIDEYNRQFKGCSELPGRALRLICYDDVAQSHGFLTPDKAAKEKKIIENYGFWEVSTQKNAVGEQTWYLKNDAIVAAKLSSGMRRVPTLTIRCQHGKTDLYIDWKSKLANPRYGVRQDLMPVGYQFEGKVPLWRNWELSTDKDAVFSPEPIEMLKQMRDKAKIYFYFTPFNQPQQTVVHDISGIDKVLDMLVNKCYN